MEKFLVTILNCDSEEVSVRRMSKEAYNALRWFVDEENLNYEVEKVNDDHLDLPDDD